MKNDPRSERQIDIESGGIWEDSKWEIHFNYRGGEFYNKCRHCVSIENGGPDQFMVPRLVLGVNEGGFNSVGICLDCILEATKDLEKPA